MRNIILSTIAILFSISLFSQPVTGNTPEALVKSGDEQVEKGQYYNALEQYSKAFKELKDKDITSKIAKTQFLLRDYPKAINQFNRILARDKNNRYIEDRYIYGQALKMNGNYSEASMEFKKYLESGSDSLLKAKAEIEIKGIELLATMKENVAIVVKNAGSNVNNPESQNSPSVDAEGNLYFGSLEAPDPKKFSDNFGTKKETKKPEKKDEKKNEEEENKDKKGDVHFSKLKMSSYSEDKGYSVGEELPEIINRVGYHTANVSFSKDGNTMFFTRSVSEGGNMMESKIYSSVKTGSGWSPALEVNGVNGDYFARHPAEGELFGSKVLFFSADIPGGKGGFDIYYATRLGENEYSSPVNIGSLNTIGNDVTPYYAEGKLYFSSDAWPGIGGLDVFSSSWNGSDWSTPLNMGLPVNSSCDDIYYKVNNLGDQGFIVSNRPDAESKSLKGKTCCDDIYLIEKRKLVIELTNIIKDEAGKPIKGATAQLIEMSSGKEGKAQSKTNTESNQIIYLLNKDKSYKVVVTKEGYFPAEVQLNTVGVTTDQQIKKEYILKQMPPESDVTIITINEPIRLNNIYYDYDDDKILKDAEKDLKFILELMQKYPDMVIELGSHTDARGDDNYNAKLSERRANSARRWLINKGINGERIQAKGYGESKILNQCTNGEECSDAEHRFNRRTEFKIIAGPTTIEVKKEVLNPKAKPNNKGK